MTNSINMRRFLTFWLVGTQLPGLFAIWAAKNMAIIAVASKPPGFDTSWPLIAWSGFAGYILLVLALSAASWLFYRREEGNVALVLTTLVLVVTLPILAYSFVHFFAVR